MKKVVTTANSPKAIGPYSQGIAVDKLLFTSGQIPVDPKSGEIAQGIADQTALSLSNLWGVVEAGGSKKENIIKTTVYLKNMNDFGAMNEVYAKFFGDSLPARTCVEVARLPKDVLVEIEAIALIG